MMQNSRPHQVSPIKQEVLDALLNEDLDKAIWVRPLLDKCLVEHVQAWQDQIVSFVSEAIGCKHQRFVLERYDHQTLAYQLLKL